MSNEYYNASGAPGTGSTMSSAVLRSECQSIESAFDKLPPIAGKSGLPVFVNDTATGTETKSIAAARALLLLPVTNYAHPNHTGDVTSVADGATTIAAKAVTLAKMADMATASILGRTTAAAGAPEVLSVASAQGLLEIQPSAISILGTTGYKLVSTVVNVRDGTAAGSIKVSTTGQINASNIAEDDNLAPSDTDADFALNAGGDTLTLINMGLTGTLAGVLSVSAVQVCGTAIQLSALVNTGKIDIAVKNAATGAVVSLPTLIDAGSHTVDIYLTYLVYN